MEVKIYNKCEVCGAPCKVKYCKDCAYKVQLQQQKACRQGKKKPKYAGCNEDCFNCPYPDCLKPAQKMNRENNYRPIRRISGESQARMFTVELGKMGGATPNISRSWW
jgi:hypothetical protein